MDRADSARLRCFWPPGFCCFASVEKTKFVHTDWPFILANSSAFVDEQHVPGQTSVRWVSSRRALLRIADTKLNGERESGLNSTELEPVGAGSSGEDPVAAQRANR